MRGLIKLGMAVLAAALMLAPAHAQRAKASAAAPPSPTPIVLPPFVPMATFGETLDRAARAPDFVGLGVAVVRDGRVTLMRTYGLRDAGGNELVTPDTVFRIASLSKAFAGTLAAQDVTLGKLDLKAKASAYAPTFKMRKGAEAAVTLEDTLTHRTGLPPYAFDNLLEEDVSPEDILGRYANVRPACPAHQCFSYQNTAFNIIATALEAVEGKTYAQLINERIFAPLGMKNASVDRAGLMASGDWARPHVRRDDAWRSVAVKEPYYRVPAAGGVNASLRDMSTWLIAQMGDRPDVIRPEVLAMTQAKFTRSPQEMARLRALKMPGRNSWYGLGWRITDYSGHTLINHTGSVEGYWAQIAFLPETRSGIVILSNTRGLRAARLLPTWLDYELGLKKQDWLELDLLDALTAAGVTE